ncbi:MAG: HD domain-containing phosphohydrolase, partial [Candidatus Brocadiia bacterium]
LCARIMAVADVYDALRSKRPYKPAFTHEESRRTILDGAGRHFDPAVTDAFVAVEADFARIREELHDSQR